MKKELLNSDKELLLKDLCARLPYEVKVESVFINPDTKEHKSCGIEVFNATSLLMIRDGLGEFKPYLFPLSSMTEEQRIEASFEFGSKKYKVNIFGDIESYSEIGDDIAYIDLENIERYIDWLNEHHFDYRGLIKKGLAVDATNLNIY